MTGPLNVGDLIGGRYEIERYIDEGGMQFVYAATDKLANRVVALNRLLKYCPRTRKMTTLRVPHPLPDSK